MNIPQSTKLGKLTFGKATTTTDDLIAYSKYLQDQPNTDLFKHNQLFKCVKTHARLQANGSQISFVDDNMYDVYFVQVEDNNPYAFKYPIAGTKAVMPRYCYVLSDDETTILSTLTANSGISIAYVKNCPTAKYLAISLIMRNYSDGGQTYNFNISDYGVSKGLRYADQICDEAKDLVDKLDARSVKYSFTNIAKDSTIFEMLGQGYLVNRSGNLGLTYADTMKTCIFKAKPNTLYTLNIALDFIAYIKSDKISIIRNERVSGGIKQIDTTGLDDVAYIALSHYNNRFDNLVISEGNAPSDVVSIRTDSQPFIDIDSKFGKLLGQAKQSASTTGSLGNGDILQIDCLNSIRAHNIVSFSCRVDGENFNSIVVGCQNHADTYSKKIVINSSKMIYYKSNSDESPLEFEHGLTIKNSLQVNISLDQIDKYVIDLVSSGMSYQATVTDYKASVLKYYAKKLEDDGITYSNCKLSWFANDINKDIWVFGDSYISKNNYSWFKYLIDAGYDKNCLVDSYSGEASRYSLDSFKTLIKYGSPKYVYWCVGMNDGTDPDDNTPTNYYKQYFDELIQLCNTHNINLIAQTIPSVWYKNDEHLNNKGKNAYIKQCGIRYVDVEKAVGADLSNTWYDDMLQPDSNRVHPTIVGAKAIYNQVLIDFPEITQTP